MDSRQPPGATQHHSNGHGFGRGRGQGDHQSRGNAVANTRPVVHRRITSSPKSSEASSNGAHSSSSGQNSHTQRALLRRADETGIFLGELKIKIPGLPPNVSPRNVYESLYQFGNIVRIEIQSNNAWVIFSHPPQSLPTHLNNQSIRMGSTLVKLEVKRDIYPRMVRSPVNPARQYRELTYLGAESIDFGIKTAENAMRIMHTTEAKNQVFVTLNLNRKHLDIKFPQLVDGGTTWYRFTLPIAQLEGMHAIKNHQTGTYDLIIPFEAPPLFFQQAKKNLMHKTFNPSDRAWTEWNAWYRLTHIVDKGTQTRMLGEPLRNYTDNAIIDIGRWTCYRLSFNKATLNSLAWEDFRDALADHGITINEQSNFVFQERLLANIWGLLPNEMSTARAQVEPSAASAFDDLSTTHFNMIFSVRYQLEVCLSNGYLREHSITHEFMNRLTSMDATAATRILEKVADKQRVHFDPMGIFQLRVKRGPEEKIPSYCVHSRSVTITPTTIYINTPVVETSNRIIRKHIADADRFIRVKFTDEKAEGRLHGQGHNRWEAVFQRISHAMEEGIVVAGRHYVFLAFGNSQFRENGAYFYAPTPSASADSIRSTMGRFDHIKVVAKYGARVGQCFSTTRSIHNVPAVQIVEIADIVRNGFTFTDGVGKLSFFLAQMAAQELGLQNAFDDPPSLYQFRLGGCKGVLAIDPSLSGNLIQLRPSQYKFPAESKGLEIIRSSAFATAYFNRQLIIVLSTLGVEDHIFIRKQQEMVNNLERATKEENVALEKLQRNIDLNQVSLTIAAMVLDGFMRSREPFMMSLLQLWQAFNIKGLKEKARIMIEEGAFVLGCVDETATLRGHFDNPQCSDTTRDKKLATLPEIFIQISDPLQKGHYTVVEGVCVLARNPSLHAGDIRVVRAVDVPALHHLKNVVVLPQTGDRDIANMCSGGDLDGDDYLVLWDSNFLPDTINETPMDFTPEKPTELDRPVCIKDMTDFFVTYMKNDSLSRIAVAHLAQADMNAEGVRSDACLELAQLHSQAVDYPKSGIPAIMDRKLRPRKWPHFMESNYRTKNQIYRSRNILGMLYDQVKLVDFKPQYEYAFDTRILNAFESEPDEALNTQASKIKESYDSSLKRLMAKHEIRTEFEAWSVFVLSHNQESRDYTFAEEFGKSVEILKTQHREMCRKAAGAAAAAETLSDFAKMAPFVAAMYRITAREVEQAVEECRETIIVSGRTVPKRRMTPESMPLMSFPWLFVKELGKIATGNSSRQSLRAQHYKASSKGHRARTEYEQHLGSGMGIVETERGVVQIGDSLELLFDNLQT